MNENGNPAADAGETTAVRIASALGVLFASCIGVVVGMVIICGFIWLFAILAGVMADLAEWGWSVGR